MGSRPSENWDLGAPHHWTVLREGDPRWSGERWQVMQTGTHVRYDSEDLETPATHKAPAFQSFTTTSNETLRTPIQKLNGRDAPAEVTVVSTLSSSLASLCPRDWLPTWLYAKEPAVQDSVSESGISPGSRHSNPLQ